MPDTDSKPTALVTGATSNLGLEAADFGPDVSGKFFASKPKKMTGGITEIQMDHFDNPSAQQALWKVMSQVTGGAEYPAGA